MLVFSMSNLSASKGGDASSKTFLGKAHLSVVHLSHYVSLYCWYEVWSDVLLSVGYVQFFINFLKRQSHGNSSSLVKSVCGENC